MDKFELLQAVATRQFRHNDDNSPDMFEPVGGFVIAYDKDVIDKGLKELRAKLEAAESRDVVTPEYFQSWVDRAYEAEATLKAVGKIRDDLATQCLNNHAVAMLDKALLKERDDG